MNTVTTRLLAACLTLIISAAAFASIEIELRDGTRWRGDLNQTVIVEFNDAGIATTLEGQLLQVHDLYIKLSSKIAGKVQEKVIFRADIADMTTIGNAGRAPATSSSSVSSTARPRQTTEPAASKDVPRDDQGRELGVFVLPLEGGVGEEFRHNEIEMLGKEADRYGPGQIIVIVIKSNGGLVLESEIIAEVIADIKKRHRVVAWVNKAISAGCMTAMCCDEIYFMTEGIAGSVTTVMGIVSLQGPEVERHVENFVEVSEASGYSEHIARAMKLNKYMCSYDKDPVTGEITWYGDTSGEFVLSTEEQNLCFNSHNALHCGFSKGTADTEEDLARLLDLPRWHEISDYGREIAEDWKRTYKRMSSEVPRLMTRLSYYKAGSGDREEIIGGRINILKDLMRWAERAPLVAAVNYRLDPESLERDIRDLQKELADIRRARRGGR